MTNELPVGKTSKQSESHYLLTFLLVTLAYFVSGRLGLMIPFLGTHITLIWLPTGISVAVLWRWGYGYLPAIFFGALITNFSVDSAPQLDFSIALGNTLAPLLSVWLLRRFKFHGDCDRAYDILLLIAAAMVGMLISSGGGALSLLAFDVVEASQLAGAWMSWWAGDTIGVLLAAPIILNYSMQQVALLWARRVEYLVWAVIIAAASWGVFFFNHDSASYSLPVVFSILPLVVWAAMRFGVFGSSLGVLIPVVISAMATGQGVGPFDPESAHDGQFLLWSFFATIVLIELMVAALQAGRSRMEAALQLSEAQFRQMFERNSSIMMLIDPNSGQIVDANDAASRFYGYAEARLTSMNISQINCMPAEKVSAERAQAVAGSRSQFLFPHRLASGAIRTVEVHSSPIEVDGNVLLFSIIHDITERAVSEAKLQRLMSLYDALSQCDQAILRCTSRDELFRQVCGYAVEAGGLKMAWIGIVDEGSRMITVAASYGSGMEYLNEIRISVDPDDPSGRGPIGMVVRENHPYWCQDYLNDPKLALWHERGKRAGWASSAALPLRDKEKVIGTLNLYAEIPNAFDEAARNLLEGMAKDISYALTRFSMLEESRQTEEALRLAAVTFETQEAIVITDPAAKIMRVNQAFQDITGYGAEEVIGRNPNILQSGRHDAMFYKEMWATLLDTGKWKGEIWDKRRDGEIYPKLMTITAVYGSAHQVTHYVAVFRDISLQKKSEDEIHQLAFYDSLTRLPNRRLLIDRLQQAIVASARNDRYGALLFLDLDHFKTINDTQGHVTGDLLLIEVAHRLKSCLREGDSVARLGGDEFVLVLAGLSGVANEASSQTGFIAEKIHAALARPFVLNDFECQTSASIGIRLFKGHAETVEDLLMHADVAMYHAKSAGRNASRFFDPSMQTVLDDRASLETDLRHALDRKELRLFYQIQVDSLRRPLGAEILLRWQHAARGMIMPGQFIQLSEETGLIVPIGLWVLEVACDQLRIWQNDALTRELTLAVNVSARQFRQPDFVAQVQRILVSSGAKPGLLKLELTESTVLEDVQDTIGKMREIKMLGVRFSMDDFGTGYSSLQYLKRLPLDQIKIDQSFVRDITTDPNDAAIVQTIIAMTDALGLNVIAEGVETAEQLDFLDEHGCHAFQGYLFSKPVPLDQFEALLSGK